MQRGTPLLADFISLSESVDSSLPLHQQLYGKIRSGIVGGSLKSGDRLPASRLLAAELNLSRNTVLTAYDQLTAEGYLVSRKGAGTFVSSLKLNQTTAKTPAPQPLPVASRIQHLVQQQATAYSINGIRLLPGLADPIEFPYQQWSRLQNRHSKIIGEILPHYDLSGGYLPLRRALASHLATARGVNADPEQIFITAGTAQSLTLITRVLSDPGDEAWVEDPGYPVATTLFKYADLKVRAIPVDSHGLNPESLKLGEHQPGLIYLTTSYQYPLGYTMPVARRVEILEIARQKNAWILEDDYDGEFRYRGKPIPALFGLEDNERTLYLGTFSKTLSPGLRMSFVVVPKQLANIFRHAYPMLGNESTLATQATLAEFISRGFFARHVKRMRKIYGARRDALEQGVQQYCEVDAETFDFNPGGLHLALGLGGQLRDTHIVQRAAQSGIGCLPLSAFYYNQTNQQQGLLLGYTSCGREAMLEALVQLQVIITASGGTLTPLSHIRSNK